MKNEGPYSIFDTGKGNEGPASIYKFKRYIGQRVMFQSGKIGIVWRIEPYYTIVKTREGLLAGTPTTICEAKKGDIK